MQLVNVLLLSEEEFCLLWILLQCPERRNLLFFVFKLLTLCKTADFPSGLKGSGLQALSNELIRLHIWHSTWLLIWALKLLWFFLSSLCQSFQLGKYFLIHFILIRFCYVNVEKRFSPYCSEDKPILCCCEDWKLHPRIVTRDSLEDRDEGRSAL